MHIWVLASGACDGGAKHRAAQALYACAVDYLLRSCGGMFGAAGVCLVQGMFGAEYVWCRGRRLLTQILQNPWLSTLGRCGAPVPVESKEPEMRPSTIAWTRRGTRVLCTSGAVCSVRILISTLHYARAGGTYVCMYVCMYVYMYVRMYVYIIYS